MRQDSKRTLGWVLLAVTALAGIATVDAATLNKRARLRQGASKDTPLLGWVEEAVSVPIEGQRGGWYLIRTPDGQSGFIWQEHLTFAPGEQAAAGTVPSTTAAPLPTTSSTGRATTSTVSSTSIPAFTFPTTLPPVQHSDPPADSSGPELERLRADVARLTATQQDLVQRIERGGLHAIPPPITTDGTTGAALTFLTAGGIGGLVLGYLLWGWGRRERRSRIRL